MDPRSISINDYDYRLPDEKIALHPLTPRDSSKLLLYKEGEITESLFTDIDKHIPANTLLVLNNTKVINARIKFRKHTGTGIEIFCLEPVGSVTDFGLVMQQQSPVQWKCLVGGAAKWKDEILQKEIQIAGDPVILSATKLSKENNAFVIEFSWESSDISFAEIISAAGNVPLPPYIKRDAETADEASYQTVFATHHGSVAAPTAGLHFSESVLKKLSQTNPEPAFVTLHVGAGTFKPVNAPSMSEHEMHAEYISVTDETIELLKKNIGKIAAVGTTSLRTIESLYWLGVKALQDPEIKQLSLMQWDVYDDELSERDIPAKEALTALKQWLHKNKLKRIFTQTQILIAPCYNFRIANMLVTNFHQPRSTLLLLVAAAIGDDWKKMYDYALQNDFRFLSYGDANLIFIKNSESRR